ncbi:hypothetical protein Syun_013398 [Stephania yunnanensis]|uniref:DYW domain-containing protein n=1 Tax=Stephania yunnanensis TaxID=152371 RepID=A0AAP0K1A2_9MAGN
MFNLCSPAKTFPFTAKSSSPKNKKQSNTTTISSHQSLKIPNASPPKSDLITYSILLKSCIRSRDFDRGKQVHSLLMESGVEFDSVLTNSLISLYSKCGDWRKARSVFDEMPERNRDLVSWSAMISCFANNNRAFDAIVTFYKFLELGFPPNEYCFTGAIRACSNAEYAWIGVVVFGLVIKTGHFNADVCVGCELIEMFVKGFGDLVSARKVFDEMPEKKCGCVDAYDKASGLALDVCVGSSLVDMYAKCAADGSMVQAKRVFDRMPDRNVMSWTAIIAGHVQREGFDLEAIKLFCEMMVEGRVSPNHFTYSSVLKACASLSNDVIGEQIHSNVVKSGLASINCVGNSLISMYARSGRMEEARKAFDILFEKNLISYNTIVDGYAKNSNSEGAFELFHQIEDTGIGASSFTFASLLSGVASIGAIVKGEQVHGRLIKSGFESDRCIGNALISMYSRCGNIDGASQVFNEMEMRNVISWTSMITGLAKHGYAARALKMFREMVDAGIKPNEVTYIAVLSACSHVGMVAEGMEHFNSMNKEHGIVPRMEHYACVVDLLGRSSLLEEALEFINSMPLNADALVWRTLLGACRVHGNMKLGEIAAKHILEIDPHDPAAYILLSNLYASTNQWNNVGEIRKKMKERKLRKEAGCSWIEDENTMHKFYVGDTTHPKAREIFDELARLASEIKDLGYVPDIDFVLHDVEDEQREQYLFQHSEKIALAFSLITTPNSKPIRIFKNLRVCGDCHNAMKYISVSRKREIVVRDSNRFHHFKDGVCSCNDYW